MLQFLCTNSIIQIKKFSFFYRSTEKPKKSSSSSHATTELKAYFKILHYKKIVPVNLIINQNFNFNICLKNLCNSCTNLIKNIKKKQPQFFSKKKQNKSILHITYHAKMKILKPYVKIVRQQQVLFYICTEKILFEILSQPRFCINFLFGKG